VFDDWRYKAKVIAYLGCAVANLNDVPSGYTVPQLPDGSDDLQQLRLDIRAFCESPSRTHPLVLPKDVTFTLDGNPWQEILDANGAPSAIRMASGVPDSWTAVEESA